MAYFEPRGDSIRVTVRLPNGKRVKRTFSTKAEAEIWASRSEQAKTAGTLDPSSAIKVEALFMDYMEYKTDKRDGSRWDRMRLMKWANSPLGALRVTQVTRAVIHEWIHERERQVSGSTVNREMNLMQGAFTYAVEVREWIKENPCSKANRPAHNPPRSRPLLTEDEIKAIRLTTGYDSGPTLETKTAKVGAMFLLGLETGIRSGEMLKLKHEHYMREKRTVLIAALETGGRKTSKSGTQNGSRLVPLTSEAVRILDQLVEASPKDQPYIIGMTDGSRDALWRKARNAAGINDLTFHDSKHEAATRLAKYLDPIELSHAIGTRDLKHIRDTYYVTDMAKTASRLPAALRSDK